MSKRTRAPRRRIERIATQVVQNSVPTAGKTIVIHNAEDTKTLIRVLLDISFAYLANEVNDRRDSVDLVLHVAPAGVSVASAVLAAVADRVVPLQEIARWTFTVMCLRNFAATGGTDSQIWQNVPRIHADISAMRKMKETDELRLGVIAGTNDNEVKMDGNIYAWFKE